MNNKLYYAYIMASQRNGTLYTGVTGDLARRVWEHKSGLGSVFVKRYRVHRLVWYAAFDNPSAAIQREKTIKKWSRKWKLNLIESENAEWRDLFKDLGPC